MRDDDEGDGERDGEQRRRWRAATTSTTGNDDGEWLFGYCFWGRILEKMGYRVIFIETRVSEFVSRV